MRSFFEYLTDNGHGDAEAREIARRIDAYKETEADKALFKQYVKFMTQTAENGAEQTQKQARPVPATRQGTP